MAEAVLIEYNQYHFNDSYRKTLIVKKLQRVKCVHTGSIITFYKPCLRACINYTLNDK